MSEYLHGRLACRSIEQRPHVGSQRQKVLLQRIPCPCGIMKGNLLMRMLGTVGNEIISSWLGSNPRSPTFRPAKDLACSLWAKWSHHYRFSLKNTLEVCLQRILCNSPLTPVRWM